MPRVPAARSFLLPSLAAVAVTLSLVPGCSSDPPPSVQAGLKFDVVPGANGSAQCPIGGGVHFTVGGANLVPVPNGEADSDGANVSVACAVQASAGGFTLGANVTVSGHGTIVINGQLDGSRNAQNNISGAFSDTEGLGAWSSKACVITFPDGRMNVAAGRIWAHISCPAAVDGSRNNNTCDASADFRLENCN
jgi:hypothetical protein